MARILLVTAAVAASLAGAACSQADNGNAAGNASTGREAAGAKTIAASLDENGKFFQAAKAAGLDKTLAGNEPYTVLVPDDAAFAKLPAGTLDGMMKPESRGQLTGVLTYHILPGVVLAEDIGKAIDNAKGKAILATMGGGTLTATREDGKIVLTDGGGGKAVVTGADEKASNGVIHRIDTVLQPGSTPA